MKRRKQRKKRETALVLRTCDAQGRAHGGFRWPKRGPVRAKDWNPEPVCGGGLHGLLWGEGDATLLSTDVGARWLVVRVYADEVVRIGADNVKFPRGTVVHCGDKRSATDYIITNGGAGKAVVFAVVAAAHGAATAGAHGTATAGAHGTATAGAHGTATAGAYGAATAGECGTATAGERGTATAGYRGTATAGEYGTATAGEYGTATAGYRGTATAGEYGTATAGECGTATAGYRGTATAGYRGTATAGEYGTATAGAYGTATAGERGTLILRHWDDLRYRITVGYVGKNGIKPNTRYKLDANGAFVEVTP